MTVHTAMGTSSDAMDGRPEFDAASLLKTVWTRGLLETPIPVDPIRIARSLGIDTLDADLGPDVAGAIVKQGGRDPVILLNIKDSSNRKRFTCAHELGHFVRQSQKAALAGEDYEFIDLRATLASEGTDPEEIYANQFAASLLMPESQVKEFHKKDLGPVEMAYEFQVSSDAMGFRLHKLGL